MPEMKEGGVNVTPLIDIVMCMIIFFMLVARIGVSTGADSTIAVPDTVRGSRIDDLGNTLTLNVRADSKGNPLVTVLSHGEFTAVGVEESRNGKTVNPLADLLRECRKRNSDFKVIIRADREMPYQCLEPVLLACTQAEVGSVNFNTRVATP
jgi:biopolymer transport protein ExbD